MSVNLKMSMNSGLGVLLYCNFIIKKKYTVDAIAQKMGIHKDTLYKYVNGTHVFPSEQLINLTKSTEDPEYLEYITNQCGYALIPKIKDKRTAESLIQMAKVFLSATAGKNDPGNEES